METTNTNGNAHEKHESSSGDDGTTPELVVTECVAGPSSGKTDGNVSPAPTSSIELYDPDGGTGVFHCKDIDVDASPSDPPRTCTGLLRVYRLVNTDPQFGALSEVRVAMCLSCGLVGADSVDGYPSDEEYDDDGEYVYEFRDLAAFHTYWVNESQKKYGPYGYTLLDVLDILQTGAAALPITPMTSKGPLSELPLFKYDGTTSTLTPTQVVNAGHAIKVHETIESAVTYVRKNLNPNQAIYVPSKSLFPGDPQTGRIGVEMLPADFQQSQFLPVPGVQIEAKKMSYGTHTDTLLMLLPALSFPVYTSKLLLFLRETAGEVCIDAYDLLSLYMYMFQICADSADIADTPEKRLEYLDQHTRFRRLADDNLQKEIDTLTKVEYKADVYADPSHPVYAVFLSKLAAACIHFLIETIWAYEITLLSFFHQCERDPNGIPRKYFGDLRLSVFLPPPQHMNVTLFKFTTQCNLNLRSSREEEMIDTLKRELKNRPAEEEGESSTTETEMNFGKSVPKSFRKRRVKLIRSGDVKESERLHLVHGKTDDNGEPKYEPRYLHTHTVDTPFGNTQPVEMKYGRFAISVEFKTKVPANPTKHTVNFPYWSLEDVHHLWMWIQFSSEIIDVKETYHIDSDAFTTGDDDDGDGESSGTTEEENDDLEAMPTVVSEIELLMGSGS